MVRHSTWGPHRRSSRHSNSTRNGSTKWAPVRFAACNSRIYEIRWFDDICRLVNSFDRFDIEKKQKNSEFRTLNIVTHSCTNRLRCKPTHLSARIGPSNFRVLQSILRYSKYSHPVRYSSSVPCFCFCPILNHCSLRLWLKWRLRHWVACCQDRCWNPELIPSLMSRSTHVTKILISTGVQICIWSISEAIHISTILKNTYIPRSKIRTPCEDICFFIVMLSSYAVCLLLVTSCKQVHNGAHHAHKCNQVKWQ